ncbi:MAG TPA: tRNA-uridine aminocarboxypropyltransferase, partial [Noviherbaspirillum sp.]|nr:tRNA-uridine aminocarboxypropyltransferase [Noviherbaspirillum sp.]
PAPSPRLACPQCLRAARACICDLVTPVANEVELLILQHPDEVRHAKGTARLLHLSLERSVLLTGEGFAEDMLQSRLAAPAGTTNLLLYPDTPGGRIAPPPALPPALPAPARLRLVLLDATWGKSLKMLLQNPVLQRLPRVAVNAAAPGRYAIRKARRPGQLSTLEAACHALAALEGAPQRYAGLLAAFDSFVAQRLAFIHDPAQ